MTGAAWEYRVHSIGGILKGAKPEQLTEVLNRAAGGRLGADAHGAAREQQCAVAGACGVRPQQRTRREAAWTREA